MTGREGLRYCPSLIETWQRTAFMKIRQQISRVARTSMGSGVFASCRPMRQTARGLYAMHVSDAPDLGLLQRIVARDTAALAELYDRHNRLLFGVILRIVR